MIENLLDQLWTELQLKNRVIDFSYDVKTTYFRQVAIVTNE